MKRKLGSLGLMLAAVLAVGVSTASAANFFSAVHPQSVSGTQTTNHVFTTNAGTVTCKKVTFTGTTAASVSATQTLTPDYSECTAFGFISVPVDENGCGYIFNASGTTEVECPEGKKIEITVPFCTVTVGPQHIAGGMSYSNNAGETDIVATSNIKSEIDYDECGTSRTNGSYTGATTVTAAEPIWFMAAAELNSKGFQNGKEVEFCKFEKVGDKCKVEFTENAENFKVVENKWKPEKEEAKAKELYSVAVGCTVGALVKKAGCSDEIKAEKIEAGKTFEWCVRFELQIGQKGKVLWCWDMKM
ncbi:MAG TPA: hypothetical protein VHR18_11445 [Solirubrobacterales bacterium]|jgi:hypothetical protein|nr:hypothetical protein [Solirubrobacterales bacterium]